VQTQQVVFVQRSEQSGPDSTHAFATAIEVVGLALAVEDFDPAFADPALAGEFDGKVSRGPDLGLRVVAFTALIAICDAVGLAFFVFHPMDSHRFRRSPNGKNFFARHVPWIFSTGCPTFQHALEIPRDMGV